MTALRESSLRRPAILYRTVLALKLGDVGGLAGIKNTHLIVDWPLKYPELFNLGKISSGHPPVGSRPARARP